MLPLLSKHLNILKVLYIYVSEKQVALKISVLNIQWHLIYSVRLVVHLAQYCQLCMAPEFAAGFFLLDIFKMTYLDNHSNGHPANCDQVLNLPSFPKIDKLSGLGVL